MLLDSISKAAKTVARAFKLRHTHELTPLGEYRRMQDLLKERSSLEELGLVASSIEHDIQMPIASLSFHLAWLRERLGDRREFAHRIERMREDLDRAYVISRQAGVLRPHALDYYGQLMERTDLPEVIHRSVRAVKQKLGLKPEAIFFKVDMPRAPAQVYVNAYALFLQQAFFNLLEYAALAVAEPEKGKRGLVAVKVGNVPASPELTKIEITDNGRGIPEDVLPMLTTTLGGGGVGMFVARKIIELHRGELKFESEVGEGTTASIILPRYQARREPHEPAGG